MGGSLTLLGSGKTAPTASGGGGGFNAASYGTVLAWYDFTDSSKVQDNTGTPCTNGGSCDRVVDKSTNALDARQTSSGNRPTCLTNVINGKQVLDFDGSNDYLVLPSSRGLIKNLAGVTIVSVARLDSVSSSNGIFDFADNAGGHRVRCRHLGSDGQWAIETKAQDGGSSGSLYSGGGNPASTATWYITVWKIDFSGNAAQFWANGTSKGSSSSMGSTGNCSNTNASDDPAIGAGDAYGAIPLNGQMAHLIIYSGAMDDTNRDNLETALGSELGITVV